MLKDTKLKDSTLKIQVASETGICHFRPAQGIRLSQLLREADYFPLGMAVDNNVIQQWLSFGSCYLNGKRQRQDTWVESQAIIRLHTRAKRFRVPSAEDLRQRVVFEESDFLVLDKPAGLPTHPTLDNFLENAKVALESAVEHPLYTTHRLDVPTRGLLIFAKTPATQRQINKLFQKGRVKKQYRALCARPVKPGLYEHYMDPESRVPKKVYNEPLQPHWQNCQLRVELCHPLSEALFLLDITLLTGRTHQIRAQLAHIGAPVVGDAAYGGHNPCTHPLLEADGIGLECFQLSFRCNNKEYSIHRP